MFTPQQWSNAVNIDRQPHPPEIQWLKHLPARHCLHWTPAVASAADVNMVSKLILPHLLEKKLTTNKSQQFLPVNFPCGIY